MVTPTFAFSSESFEWYTPNYIIEGLRSAFDGPIHFDPASCAVANRVVRARKYYSLTERNEDALLLRWKTLGNLFCNPPYGARVASKGHPAPHGGNQKLFLNKLREEATFKQAAFLCTAAVGDAWFVPLLRTHPIRRDGFERYCSVCLFDRRVQFGLGEGESKQPTKGNALAYFGDGAGQTRFRYAFEEYGIMLTG